MLRYDRQTRTLACCLAAVAGFVDALAFLELGGFFVSFMSGNSTRLGVGRATDIAHAATAAGLIATFVLGVVLGTLVGRAAPPRRAPRIIGLVAFLLAVAAALNVIGLPAIAVAVMALAMGCENAAFERDGEISIGLTYMTGALVKTGQRLAAALAGGDRWGWAPYLLLWAGLVAGATCGALAYQRIGLQGLWIAAAAAGSLAFVAFRIETPERDKA